MGDAEERRRVLIEQIAREEAELARVAAAREKSEKRLSALRRELAVLAPTGSPPAQQESARTPTSASQKVELFRALFRGRTDVFPSVDA
jgi:hypothetical protein